MGKILVVEDDRDIRELFTEFLESEGFEVAVATDGFEALEVLKILTPCLIFTDLMMPAMNGWDFIKFMDVNNICPDVPTVALTADGTTAKFKRHVAYIKKPIFLDDVLSLCHKHCRG